jgi:DNA-binding MarR family transcriptional regulator
MGDTRKEMLFKDCVCFLIGRVSRRLNKITKESIMPYKLTTSQFFLLIALYEENGILISKLAEKVALDKATLTGIIDRLERDGFVERRDDPKDRRAIRVYLTPKAESLREELLEIYHRNNSRFLSVLSEEEREVFERVVQKLESIRGYTDEE